VSDVIGNGLVARGAPALSEQPVTRESEVRLCSAPYLRAKICCIKWSFTL